MPVTFRCHTLLFLRVLSKTGLHGWLFLLLLGTATGCSTAERKQCHRALAELYQAEPASGGTLVAAEPVPASRHTPRGHEVVIARVSPAHSQSRRSL